MTREEIIKELEDIRSAIEYDGDIVAEDSLDALADKLMTEGSTDVSEQELDIINEMVYESFMEPEAICNDLINMLMSVRVKVAEDIDPFTNDIWSEDSEYELTPEEEEAIIAANSTVFDPMDTGDHTWESVEKEKSEELTEGLKLTDELEDEIDSIIGLFAEDMVFKKLTDGQILVITELVDTLPDKSKGHSQMVAKLIDAGFIIGQQVAYDLTSLKSVKAWLSMIYIKDWKEVEEIEESVEKNLDEGHYGKDSIIDGDIPGKENGFLELIAMRFHNMGFDEDTHPLYPGAAEQMWNPFGEDSLVMFGDSPEFFQPIVSYIETEVGREDSAWYNRDYEVCEVDDGYRKEGAYALCIEARDYDRAAEAKFISKNMQAEYARRRKMRRAAKKELAPV